MAQHATVKYENGCLMPLKPLEGIPEHSILQVVVEAIEPPSTEEQLAMLREVPVAEELADAIEAGRNRINREEYPHRVRVPSSRPRA